MATIQFKNGDDFIFKLSVLERSMRRDICGKAIYNAGDIVANAIREELKKVPKDETFGTPATPKIGPSKAQKKGLYNSLGIAPLQDDGKGVLNIKIGFDGYNDLKSKKWPKGQPNQMVARAVENGTSFMKPNPFIKRAVAATRKQALEAMGKTADAEIEKIMKG